jgi:hypothetical protein
VKFADSTRKQSNLSKRDNSIGEDMSSVGLHKSPDYWNSQQQMMYPYSNQPSMMPSVPYMSYTNSAQSHTSPLIQSQVSGNSNEGSQYLYMPGSPFTFPLPPPISPDVSPQVMYRRQIIPVAAQQVVQASQSSKLRSDGYPQTLQIPPFKSVEKTSDSPAHVSNVMSGIINGGSSNTNTSRSLMVEDEESKYPLSNYFKESSSSSNVLISSGFISNARSASPQQLLSSNSNLLTTSSASSLASSRSVVPSSSSSSNARPPEGQSNLFVLAMSLKVFLL